MEAGIYSPWVQKEFDTTWVMNLCVCVCVCVFVIFSYSLQDLVPWPGIEPGPPVFGSLES